MEPREFIVKVGTKKRRVIKNDSSYFFQFLKEVVNEIIEIVVETKDMGSAFDKNKVSVEYYELLVLLIKWVLDVVAALLTGKNIKHKHRLSLSFS